MKCQVCGNECQPSYTRWESNTGCHYIWLCPIYCKTEEGKVVWNGWCANMKRDPDKSDACSTYITDLMHPDYPKDEMPENVRPWLFPTEEEKRAREEERINMKNMSFLLEKQ